ncbi:MAG: hypothetical protein K8R58_00540, partial [Bacteroidales bacterium]|nr:hypothetical protein [Bacteroidales bacterium]
MKTLVNILKKGKNKKTFYKVNFFTLMILLSFIVFISSIKAQHSAEIIKDEINKTDVNHSIAKERITSLPESTVASFEYLGFEDLGNGLYEHNYKLNNISGSIDLYDVDMDYEYRYGWVSVNSPDDWYFAHGPMSRWATETAPCTMGTEIYGYSITAGTPDVISGGVYFTDVNHSIVYQGT